MFNTNDHNRSTQLLYILKSCSTLLLDGFLARQHAYPLFLLLSNHARRATSHVKLKKKVVPVLE